MVFMKYGRNVYFFPGVRIVRPQYISIGDNVTIGRNTDIFVHPDDPETHERSLRSATTSISERITSSGTEPGGPGGECTAGPPRDDRDHTHAYEDIEVPIKFQTVTEPAPVRIERDSWIARMSSSCPM